MKIKQESSTWKIAAIHFLIARLLLFLISGAIALIIGFALIVLAKNLNQQNVTDWILRYGPSFGYIVGIIITPVVVWFSVKYSASYITSKYVIEDAAAIVRLATIYTIVVETGSRLYQLKTTGFSFSNELMLNSAVWVVQILVFYIASKKYISAKGPVTQQQSFTQ